MALVKCPDCGSEVSETAPTCVKCGRPIAARPAAVPQAVPITPAAKPGTSKLLLGVLGCAGLFGLCIFLGVVGRIVGPPRDRSHGAPPSSPGTPAAPPKQEEPVAVVSADDIVADYEANEVGADNNYKDKLVEVRGSVDKVGKDITGSMYVTLIAKSRHGMRNVQVFFDDSHSSELGQLSQHSYLAVRGRVKGLMGNVLIGDGVIVGR